MAALLVNPPCRVVFEGWESDTYRLGCSGWKVAFEQDPYNMEPRIMISHPAHDIHFMAVAPENSLYAYRSELGRNYPIFRVVRLMRGNTVMRSYAPTSARELDGYRWVSTEPAMIDVKEWTWGEHPLFRELEKPIAEEIIAEPATVMQLLDQIRSMQAPEQARIRATQRRSEAPPVIHASILSFPTAA